MTPTRQQQAVAEALKPCPFCGKPGRAWRLNKSWGVECSGNQHYPCVSMPACFGEKDDAIGAWNTRADSDARFVPGLVESLKFYRSEAMRGLDMSKAIAKGDLILAQLPEDLR